MKKHFSDNPVDVDMVISFEDFFGQNYSGFFFADQLIVGQVLDDLHFLVSL
jgi:hypothetical protein